jgi:hypothetical protein
MSHLSQDELLAFAAGRLGEEAAEHAYGHLGACEACAQRFEAVREIRADFEGSWDEFLNESRARCAERTTEAETPRLQATGEVLLRGLIDGVQRLATAAGTRLTELTRGPGSFQTAFCPVYTGVGDPAETGEASRLAERASRLCGEGKDREARSLLRKAAGLDRQAGESVTLDLLFERDKIGEVVVDAGRRSVYVLIQPKGPGGARGSVVLTPESASLPELRVELQPVEGAYYSLAEFEDVPSCSFSLLVRLDES